MAERRRAEIEKTDVGSATAIDAHIGTRLRKLRSMLGMSQDQLGRSLGLTFQQIQKYEHGTNRIAASRLYHISKILNVPVAYFFEEMGDNALTAMRGKGFSESGQAPLEAVPVEAPVTEHREALEFWRAYNRLDSAKLRRKMYELMRSFSEE